MGSLFKNNKILTDDSVLIEKALKGDKTSLEDLIKKHQNWVYNVAISMVSDKDDAADITQEVLIKMVTKLGTFKNGSSFSTWLYRITKNHFLNMKRSKYEVQSLSFSDFGNEIDSIPDELVSNYHFEIDEKMLVEEAKISCMKGMLLCLDREQRFIFIIGEIFEFSDVIGSEVMEISKENFRVKLHRAKTQLYSFMNNKCGLVNKNNPCRCAKKTVGFIKAGYVDPIHLNFQKNKISTISNLVHEKIDDYNISVIEEYKKLYQEHPFIESPDGLKSIKKLLSSDAIKKTFDLN